jgi:hypothetical protein
MIQSYSTVKIGASEKLTHLPGPIIPSAGGQLLGEKEEDISLLSFPFRLQLSIPPKLDKNLPVSQAFPLVS